MKKLLSFTPYLVIIILGYLFLNQCSKNSDLKKSLDVKSIKTDTIYKDRIMENPKAYSDVINPTTLTKWKTDTIKIPYKSLTIKHDTIVLYNSNSKDSLKINKSFLTQYPLSSKLVSMDLKLKSLDLYLIPISGVPESKHFDIDMDNYNYIYSDNQLTYKKKSNFKLVPSIAYTFRPLNNLHDLDLTLNLKTTKFIYCIGVNGFSYPNFNKSLGYDIITKIQYNF